MNTRDEERYEMWYQHSAEVNRIALRLIELSYTYVIIYDKGKNSLSMNLLTLLQSSQRIGLCCVLCYVYYNVHYVALFSTLRSSII